MFSASFLNSRIHSTDILSTVIILLNDGKVVTRMHTDKVKTVFCKSCCDTWLVLIQSSLQLTVYFSIATNVAHFNSAHLLK